MLWSTVVRPDRGKQTGTPHGAASTRSRKKLQLSPNNAAGSTTVHASPARPIRVRSREHDPQHDDQEADEQPGGRQPQPLDHLGPNRESRLGCRPHSPADRAASRPRRAPGIVTSPLPTSAPPLDSPANRSPTRPAPRSHEAVRICRHHASRHHRATPQASLGTDRTSVPDGRPPPKPSSNRTCAPTRTHSSNRRSIELLYEDVPSDAHDRQGFAQIHSNWCLISDSVPSTVEKAPMQDASRAGELAR